MGEIPFHPILTPDNITIHGSVGRAKITAENIIEKVQNSWAQQRAAILQMPSHEQGMDMDRVHGFRERLAIPGREIRVLSPRDFKKAVSISGSDPHGEDGRFLSRLGLIVINRDPDVEQLNGGPRYWESLTVHEIAHSDTATPTVSADVVVRGGLIKKNAEIEIIDLRSGYLELTDNGFVGFALEEGYAEMTRGRYLREELGMEVGFGGRNIPNQPNPVDIYTIMGHKSDGSIATTIVEGATSALVLDLLIARDKLLLPALQTGRYTEDGLTEVRSRMNAIKPGFYEKFRAVNIKGEDGYLRLREIF